MIAPELQFGDYIFRASSGLYLRGLQVPLPPKEQKVLALLLERAGDVVLHREIEASVWPRQEISSIAVARTIHSLRQALGGSRQQYIATVPKRGYRLNVAVVPRESSGVSSIAEASMTSNRQAYAHFIEGLREANRGAPASQERAAALFAMASKADPNYAAAPAALAEVRVYQALRGYIRPDEALALGRSACQAALAISPENVSARCTCAWIHGMTSGETEGALRSIDSALNDDPQHAQGEIWRSFLLRAEGRVDEAVAAARMAAELEPHSIFPRNAVAWCLFAAGKAEEALEIERQIIAELPYVDEIAYGFGAVIAAWLGNFDEANRACEFLTARFESMPAVMSAVGYVLAEQGKTAEALALAARLEKEDSPRAPRPWLAPIYIAAGDLETAIRLLRDARDESCPWFRIAHVDPRNRRLADTPQFLALYEET